MKWGLGSAPSATEKTLLTTKNISTFLLALILALGAWAAQAKVYIDLDAPSERKLAVAVEDFTLIGDVSAPGADSIGKELKDALVSDIIFSDLFTVVNGASAPSGAADSAPDHAYWRGLGADAVVTGSYSIAGGKMTVEVRLFDAAQGSQLIGKRYTGSAKAPRRLIHYFSDRLYEEFTGKKGVFTTRLLFVSDRTGKKEIYISDYDGKGVRQITKNNSINLTPQWSSDGTRVLYTSFKKGWPCVHLYDLRTGADTLVSSKPGLNMGARFSPDDSEIALTLGTDKSPELYILNLAQKSYRQLTNNFGIDVSPDWSPDGKRLVYTSDTSGSPHIFVLDLNTVKPKRLSFGGTYNASPAYSPDGTKIAFSRSDKGAFNIWVMDSDGANPRQLTFEGSNRNPSWSPDGRHIVYSSTTGGRSSLHIMRADGTGDTTLDVGAGNERHPVWSPFLM